MHGESFPSEAIVAQLVKIFSAFYATRLLIAMHRTAHHWTRNFSQLNALNTHCTQKLSDATKHNAEFSALTSSENTSLITKINLHSQLDPISMYCSGIFSF
jgi:hypothetical protein